ncbi:hypothetical protein DF185_19200 [Marinifilum breve]|uniref:Uncharacterized protein n=1 Tax=Marinifilum breve TaxID=2184082 RepID=A0A2V3ZTG1_9BACT|nr:hypothetical protein [Marinifilum breve]PXX97145.1 hypothetical protein DF185_19200 [Marinifilum breve]
MKNLLLVAILLFCGINLVDAQIRMKTPEGKYVLLFNNGTWKYEEKIKLEEIKDIVPLNSKEEVAKEINLKDALLEKQVVIKGESVKIAKFKDDLNTVKCDFQIVSKDNKVVLKTNWKLMDEEGFRFFGFITKKSFLSFELSNGEIVILHYKDSFEPKEYIKYGFTTYSAELELSHDQITKLQTGYILNSSMKWTRRTETYNVINPDYFIKELPKILK